MPRSQSYVRIKFSSQQGEVESPEEIFRFYANSTNVKQIGTLGIGMNNLLHENLTKEIIGACIEVRKELGPGLLESAYEACLGFELSQRNLKFRKQVKLPINYKTVKLDCAYVMDIVVEEKVVLELKSVENVLPIHEAQLISYLKLSGFEVGLLLNFNVNIMKKGIKRWLKINRVFSLNSVTPCKIVFS